MRRWSVHRRTPNSINWRWGCLRNERPAWMYHDWQYGPVVAFLLEGGGCQSCLLTSEREVTDRNNVEGIVSRRKQGGHQRRTAAQCMRGDVTPPGVLLKDNMCRGSEALVSTRTFSPTVGFSTSLTWKLRSSSLSHLRRPYWITVPFIVNTKNTPNSFVDRVYSPVTISRPATTSLHLPRKRRSLSPPSRTGCRNPPLSVSLSLNYFLPHPSVSHMHRPHANHMSVQRRRIQSCFTFFLHIRSLSLRCELGQDRHSGFGVRQHTKAECQTRDGYTYVVVDFAAADLLGICIQRVAQTRTRTLLGLLKEVRIGN
ncbi:hypothetical protein EDD17DRAFT_554965 [Pisolithus thermaeus]|nr:hypothetical protein EDD17DRAFT_554965 [Pisolithus thermaeus]